MHPLQCNCIINSKNVFVWWRFNAPIQARFSLFSLNYLQTFFRVKSQLFINCVFLGFGNPPCGTSFHRHSAASFTLENCHDDILNLILPSEPLQKKHYGCFWHNFLVRSERWHCVWNHCVIILCIYFWRLNWDYR